MARQCGKRVLLVSTDPAHSLSDAFRCDFGNDPTNPGVENLDVMEVDPTETMQKELNKWADLAKEMSLENDAAEGSDGESSMVSKIQQFQEWLSGIPGIDEATALSSAIEHVESDKYDVIVFDTAPTGHTLKLLGMPGILEAGIEKLQGWQSTLWGYWDVLKGMGSSASQKRMKAKEEVADMYRCTGSRCLIFWGRFAPDRLESRDTFLQLVEGKKDRRQHAVIGAPT